MKLSEIFAQLTYGELSQISIGGAEQGEIDYSNYDQILAHINLGLTALYKRFPLKQGRLTIELQKGRFTYPLKRLYAESNADSSELIKFIKDVSDPYYEDIHKVESVYTKDGWELGLNDEADIYAISTPSAYVLRVPSEIVANEESLDARLRTTTLEVVYRANHPIIAQGAGFEPTTYEVELPYSHLEPLLLFVASRFHNPMGMVNEFNAGNNYAAKYEQACQLLEVHNLKVDQGRQSDKLHARGWV